VSRSTAVVHTLGILLEDQGYKKSIRDNDPIGILKAFVAGGSGGNPLKGEGQNRMGYEGMNRDSGELVLLVVISQVDSSIALQVIDTMLANNHAADASTNSVPSSSASTSRPFVYISAADCFRPLVPARYIETKREAELEIARRCTEHPEAGVRPLFIRPGKSLCLISLHWFSLSAHVEYY
jgi:hypothetical protein